MAIIRRPTNATVIDSYALRYRINRPQDVFNRGQSGGGPPPQINNELIEETVGVFGQVIHEETVGTFGFVLVME